MEDGSGDEDGGRGRRRGWRMEKETGMENGDVYGVQNAHRVNH